jgi:ABC-2 type transport system ATP-binding protein
MVANDSVQVLADRVRQVIRRDPRDGAAALVTFASASATSTKLKHEALLLKFSQGEAQARPHSHELEKQMLELVDRIALDHAQHADDAQVAVRQQAWQALRQRLSAEPQVDQPILLARGLCKRYKRTSFQLEGVDLQLRAGEIAGLVAQNAHGKTTLLRMVAGELRPDEGSLLYPLLARSEKRDWVAIKSQIAYLPQELPAWHGALLDNLHYSAALRGLRGQDNEREVQFIVERLDLRPHLAKTWSGLSGGYKLRFSLAHVLLGKPKLLVLDEPLANLDPLAQARLLRDITDLSRSRRYPLAVIMSSQHVRELEAVASTMIFLNAGRVEFNGPVSAIGRSRDYNAYEIGGSVDPVLLRSVLGGSLMAEPQHNGVSYVLRTRRDVGAKQILQRLLDHGVEIWLFRDISRSLLSMFE